MKITSFRLVKCIFFLFPLSIIIGFVISKNRLIHHGNKISLNHDFTAIILHWNRLFGVQQTVATYLKYSIFKEIIVWNNNPEIKLSLTDILNNTRSSNIVRIINSPLNLKDEAKYRACAQAKTSACFYADDDWDISGYINSLIADFLSDPTVLHTATDPKTYFNNMLWTFTDSNIDLHAGFSWIGCGSVFLRKYAQQHLRFLETFLNSSPEMMTVADIFFSIWLNDMPTQLVVDLQLYEMPDAKKSIAFSSADGFPQLQFDSAVKCIRVLEHELRSKNGASMAKFSRHPIRRFPYIVKAPNVDDSLLFFTNVLPIDITKIPFNIDDDFDRATYNHIPAGRKFSHFEHHHPIKAVDQNRETCWSSLQRIKIGDFFGFDFLHTLQTVSFLLTVQHDALLQQSLDMRVSKDGSNWIPYKPSNKFRDIYRNNNTIRFTVYPINIDHDQSQDDGFRYVIFNATRFYSKVFRVCDIQLLS